MTESAYNPIKPESNRHPLLTWQFALLKIMLLLVTGVALEQPVGSIVGRIALQQKGFDAHSYDIRSNKVYAIVTGTRNNQSIERGVWVSDDGSFKIDHLPKGEYSLKMRATGFATNYKYGIFVDEGKATRLPAMSMDFLEPSVNIASNTRAFTTSEQPRFWINAMGANQAVVRVYRKDFLDFLKYSDKSDESKETPTLNIGTNLDMYKASDQPYAKLLKDDQPVIVLTRQLRQDDSDWGHAEFKISQPMPAGDYVIVAQVANPRGKTNWNITWFTVTNLGLVVKQDAEKFIVRAIDLNTLRPRKGVHISMLGRTGGDNSQPPTLGTVDTGGDGVGIIKFNRQDKRYNKVIALGTQGLDKAYGGIWTSNSSDDSDKYHTYFYTERPVYRLGQTVYWKCITRQLSPYGMQSPQAGLAIDASIEDEDNNELWKGQFKTNSHGTFNATYNIPSDGKTGGYQLVLSYPDGSKDYEHFEVAQYRKPEYLVEVTPLIPRVVAGQKIKARLKASYFFGAAVANARVKYSTYSSTDWSARYELMDRPEYYSFFDNWSDQSYDNDAGDFISEGYTQTDSNGEAIIEVDTKKMDLSKSDPYTSEYLDKRYKIQAEVTDISRMSVIGSGYCAVTAGDFALLVEPDRYVDKSGEPVAVHLTAVDYNHHPVANQSVVLKLKRWVWDKKQNSYHVDEESTATATTDARGKVSASLSTQSGLPTDTYYVCAQATDTHGDAIYDQSSVWISNNNLPYVLDSSDAEKEPLTVKLDKQVYKPGDMARVMVSGPFTGGDGVDAIVSIEGSRIFDYKIVAMKSTAQLIEIPIKSSYEPNAFVSVALVGNKHQFYNQSEMLKVTPKEHFLQFKVDTDKQKYKPGETVKYTVKAAYADGKPASDVELSLGVVDESIYSIRPETAANIQQFFYKERPNLVTTICSFPEQYSGGPDKIEPALRKDFRDTAGWQPDLLTNKDGIAIASIKLPDNLTTWRATIRGIDSQTNVGSAINKVISTQDLILRLALPRFFTDGDQGLITAVVHNYTPTAQTIKLSLATSNQFQVTQSLNQQIQVAADKAERYSWPVKLIAAGDGVITVKAIGQTAGDAMEKKLNVRPLGVMTFAAKNGLLEDDSQTVSIPMGTGSDLAPGTAHYQLGLAASSIGPVLGNFNSLIDYPYGCTEQTMSRLMPSIVAMKLHKSLGLPIDAPTEKKFSQVYTKSIAKLTDYQHSDGGWGWWQNDNSNPYLTTLVLDGLYWLKDAGYKVDPEMVQKGLGWTVKAQDDLFKQVSDPRHQIDEYQEVDWRIDLSKMLYTSSLYGQKPSLAASNWLLAQLNNLSPEALCYLSLALEKTGDHANASKTYSRLIALANASGSYLDWDHTPDLIKRFVKTSALKIDDYSYRFTGVETTALALRTVLAVDPQNVQRIESIKNWILLQHDKDGWKNTKTTAQVFLALLEEELQSKKAHPANFSVTVNLASNPVVNLLFDQQNIYSAEKIFAPPLPSSPQNIVISKSGPGRLYYNSLLTYFRNLKPGDQIAEKGTPSGLKLQRQFFRIEPAAVTSDGKMHFKSSPITNGTVIAGETVLMKVYLETPVALPYVIIDAALPSGGEVVENDPQENLLNQDDKDKDAHLMEGDWGNWWWTHEDVLDDRLVFFVTSLPAGKSEFHTMVRLEMPGTFQLNPVSLQGMYTEHVRAYSTLDSIKVVE